METSQRMKKSKPVPYRFATLHTALPLPNRRATCGNRTFNCRNFSSVQSSLRPRRDLEQYITIWDTKSMIQG